MDVKDYQKKLKEVTISLKITKEDYIFIKKKNINIGKLVRHSLSKLKGGKKRWNLEK